MNEGESHALTSIHREKKNLYISCEIFLKAIWKKQKKKEKKKKKDYALNAFLISFFFLFFLHSMTRHISLAYK